MDPAGEHIHQTFEFVRRVLNHPELLDVLPDAAALAVGELDHHGHIFQLTAAQATGASARIPRPTGYTLTLGAPYLQRPLVDEPSGGANPVALTRLFSAMAETADAAFDDLATQLRGVVDAALLVDEGEPVRQRG